MNEVQIKMNVRRVGRKPNDIPRKSHAVYCNQNELKIVKVLLKELRRIDAAREEINKAKGKAAEHQAAVRHLIVVEKEVKSVTIQNLLMGADVEF